MEIKGILKFAKLLNDFQATERVIYVKDQERMENDVEHSYQLAMVAWYVVSTYKLDLDLDKVIKYALMHDMVEVYAGDVDAFDPDPKVHEQKAEKEHQALLKLEKEFSEFPEMTNVIEDYEKKEDQESLFVYALDKLIAPVNIYLDNGRTWNKKQVSLEQILKNKTPKVKAHPEVEKYFEQLIELLQLEEDKLFKQDD
ncbi:MAG: HD domain-containing protein [Candidatus Doudnabacteria bacterium]